MAEPLVSVIIPVLNEEANLQRLLPQLQLKGVECVVVNGPSEDASFPVAQQYLGPKAFQHPGPRAAQMNFGAQQAQGGILLFLHADSILTPQWSLEVQQQLKMHPQALGAFRFGVEAKGWQYRCLELLVALRSAWLRLPYGDQGFFLRKETFFQMGGFEEEPIMEDYLFVRRFVRQGGKLILSKMILKTSPRRWERLGIWKTSWINQQILLGYWRGESFNQLKARYHQKN